jgi:L-histidine N-alpha-methyltransferase
MSSEPKNLMQSIIGGFPGANRQSDLRQFAEDVRWGLNRMPKAIPCIYFYDKTGSQLFEEICRQPEYYCTRAEAEILEKHAHEIAMSCPDPVQIVELGSGSSVKTQILLEAFVKAPIRTTYVPIDISPEILTESAAKLDRIFPSLAVKPVAARYEDGIEKVHPADGSILLVWLGSSIGNFERNAAKEFLSELRRQLSSGDRLLLGVDLIKDRALLEAAYNDRAGVTAAFNRNLLARINRELGGAFNLEQFNHNALFNSVEGRIEMHLVSRCAQQVCIRALDMRVSFSEGERIHTENSYKYHPDEIAALAGAFRKSSVRQWFDSDRLFSLSLFEV